MVELVDSLPQNVGTDAPSKFAWTKPIGLVALFLVAFLCVTYEVRSVLPPYLEASHIRQSYRHFQRYADQYDTVFFGSSRAQFQIDPRKFNDVMAARGAPAQAFNFGISALNGLDVEFVLNQVLDVSHENLRRVVIDLGDVRWSVKADHARTEQVVVRHDTLTTWRFLELLKTVDDRKPAKKDALERHRKAWFDHITSEGRGAYWLTNWVLKPAPDVPPPKRYNGFEPLDSRTKGGNDDGDSGAAKVHRHFLKNRQQFEKRVRQFTREAEKFEKNRKKRRLTEIQRALVERVVTAIHKAGAEPYFYLAPRLNVNAHYILLAEDAGLIKHVLNYSDPTRYPELYDVDNHFDVAHLNRHGAELFSERLGQDIAALEGRSSQKEGAP